MLLFWNFISEYRVLFALRQFRGWGVFEGYILIRVKIMKIHQKTIMKYIKVQNEQFPNILKVWQMN